MRMIARNYGLNIDYTYLCSLADSDRQGLAVKEVISLLDKLDFDAVAVQIDMKQIEEMPLPAILFWNKNHYVVLYKVNLKKGTYYISDPALGNIKIGRAEFISSFCDTESNRGIAIVTEPRDNFSAAKFPKNNILPSLFRYIGESVKGHLGGLNKVFFLLLFILATEIAIPFIFQNTVDRGIGERDISLVWLLAGSQILMFVGNYAANSLTDLILTKLGLKVSIKMINSYLDKLLNLPMNFYSRNSPADLLQRINDQNRIKDFLMAMPASVGLTMLNLIVFSAILVYFSPLIFVLFVSLSILNVFWMTLFLRYRREIDYPLLSKQGQNHNNLYELISGIEEIKASKAQNARVEGWHKVQQNINKLTLRSAYMKIYQNGGNLLMIRIRDAVITGICAMMVVEDQMTIGIMMTVSYIVGYLAQPFSNIVSSVNTLQDSSISYQRLDAVLRHNIDRSGKSIEEVRFITLKDLTFKYPGSTSDIVLQGCNLEIPIGKSLAIVGRSGCGKSTLIKLLSGSYLPLKGEIKVNGLPLSKIDEDSYTSHLGIVMQNGTLFSTSILENIGFSDPVPDRQKVKEAAKLACIDEFIETLPMGYDTKIGNTGIQLSGGQAQRIFIARALYRNPPILILDEATSSLDAITEARIMDNVFRFCKGRTLIVAAHRLSTVRNADKIVVIQDGKISEEGRHQDLINNQGDYAELVRNQVGQST